jgi:CheY-like chemotaxis protein
MEKKSLLLVDDNEINLVLARDAIQLNFPALQIDQAENGQEAIDKIEVKTYDLIIMDLKMPVMDGYQATKYIRNELKPPKNEVPILGMTAYAMKEERQKCMQEGMNDYLLKPFETEILIEKIEQLIKMNTVNKPLTEWAEDTPHTLVNQHIDLSYMPEVYTRNAEKKKKILTLSFNKIPNDIQKLKNNYEISDLNSIKDIAHSMKASVFFLGLTEMHGLLKDIEHNIKNGIQLDLLPSMISRIEAIWKKAGTEIKNEIEAIA